MLLSGHRIAKLVASRSSAAPRAAASGPQEAPSRSRPVRQRALSTHAVGEALSAVDARSASTQRSEFRRLVAASAQASADVEALETWAGRLAMMLFSCALLFEQYSGGHSLIEGVDRGLSGDLWLFAGATAGAATALVAKTLLPQSIDMLSSSERSPMSRVLTTSVLRVAEPGVAMRSVAEDLYARGLERSLDAVVRVVADTPAPAPNASSQALLSAVLAEEER